MLTYRLDLKSLTVLGATHWKKGNSYDTRTYVSSVDGRERRRSPGTNSIQPGADNIQAVCVQRLCNTAGDGNVQHADGRPRLSPAVPANHGNWPIDSTGHDVSRSGNTVLCGTSACLDVWDHGCSTTGCVSSSRDRSAYGDDHLLCTGWNCRGPRAKSACVSLANVRGTQPIEL